MTRTSRTWTTSMPTTSGSRPADRGGGGAPERDREAAGGVIGFGPHLMLDGYGCDRKRLQDLNLIYRVLDELPTRIGMTKLMPPYVFKYRGVKPEDWGLSGFVLIAESHVSIHTFPEKQFVSVDIFSTRTFDLEFAGEYFKEAFGMEKAEANLLDRGTEFPKELNGATRIVRAERRRVSPSAAPRHA
jgi:S-adenosylmethionine decarboxylase